MSPRKHSSEGRAQQVMARLKPIAARIKPMAARAKPIADTTRSAARRNVRKTRAWAAPQVERAGKVLQANVAPKVSDALSAAARRIEPKHERSGRWAKSAGAATLSAAAAAAAVLARGRKKAAANGAGEVQPPAGLDEVRQAANGQPADDQASGHAAEQQSSDR